MTLISNLVNNVINFTLEERILASLGLAPYNWKKPGDRVRITKIVDGRYRITFFENIYLNGDMNGCRHWKIRDQRYIAIEETIDGIIITDLTGDKWFKKEL